MATTCREPVVDAPAAMRVLCVDLDGTLASTNLLWESLLSAVRGQPWILAALPAWLVAGRAHLKQRLAAAARIEFTTLPYRQEVVSYLRAEHDRGRRIVLVTAADARLATGVAEHLGFFAEVVASDGLTNLKGCHKAACLISRYGEGNYDYVGDSRADIPVWSSAADAITVRAFPARQVKHLRYLEGARSGRERLRLAAKAIVRALRPHQWLKNLLLVVPLLAAHRLDVEGVTSLALAFVSLSLCASGGYVLNDLLDLAADRRHHRKKHRPFASGRLPVEVGVGLIALCWAVGFGLAATLLPAGFVALLGAYLVATAAYSLHLKREPVLDVMFLAGLYVMRVVAGGVAAAVPVSTWLLAFTLFVCLSLAFLKRFIEVRGHTAAAVVPGRGYQPDDASWLQAAGLASAYLSVVVLALYVNNDDVTRLYTHPDRLLLMCPVLLYWATRIWHRAHRRLIHDDPLVAVAMDPATYVIGAVSAVVVLAAV